MAKFITKTILFIVMPVLLAKLLFIYSVPYINLNSPQFEYRNPYFRRGWPEYIERSLSKSQNNAKFVIVSNSQGFGREFLEEETYSYHLQQIFKENGLGYIKVLNWSTPGGIFHDLLILSAKAISENVDYLCIVTYAGNFSKDLSKKSISFSLQDIPYILSDNSAKSLLPSKFIKEHIETEYKNSFLLEIISLLRMRDHLQDVVAKYTINKETYWWQYHSGGPGKRLMLSGKNNNQKINIGSYDTYSLKYFDEVFQKKKRTKIIIIMMPLAKIALSEKSITMVEKFNLDIKNHYEGSDIAIWDMTYSLDDELFYSHTHFSPDNHKKFAGLIFNNLKFIRFEGMEK